MKRFLAFLMTLTMLLGMVTPVMADEMSVVIEETDVETVTGTEEETLPENDADAPSGEEEVDVSDEEPDTLPEEETATSDNDADAQPEEETVAPDEDADVQPEEEAVLPEEESDVLPEETETVSSENDDEVSVICDAVFAAGSECTHPNAVSIEGSEEHFAYIKSNPGLFNVDLSKYDEAPVPSTPKYVDNETCSLVGLTLLGMYCPDCDTYMDVRLEYVQRTREHHVTSINSHSWPTCRSAGYLGGECEYCHWDIDVEESEPMLTDHTWYYTDPVVTCYGTGYYYTCDGDCYWLPQYDILEKFDVPQHLQPRIVETAATCTEAGLTHYYCDECWNDYYETAPLGHDYMNGVCVRCGAEDTAENTCAHENTESIEGSRTHFERIAQNPELFGLDLSDYNGQMPAPSHFAYLDNDRHIASGEVLLGTYCKDCGWYLDVHLENVTYLANHDHMSMEYFEPTCAYGENYKCECSKCGGMWIMPESDEKLTDHEPTKTPYENCWSKGYVLDCDICGVHGYTVVEETYDEPHHANAELLKDIYPATCTEGGEALYYCPDCDIEYYADTEALGHDYLNGVCKLCGAENPAAAGCAHENAVSIEGSEEHFACIKSNSGLFGVDLSDYDEMPVPSNYKYLNNDKHTASGMALLGTYCPDCGCYQDVRLEYVTKVQDHKIGDYVWSFYDTCVYGACDLVTCEYCGSEYKHITSDEEKRTDHEPTITPVEGCWWRGYQLDCVYCGIYGYTVTEETYDEPHHLPALSELRSTTATCTETGIDTYYCTECEVEYTAEAEALGHNYINGVCSRCGAETSMEACAHENTVSIEGDEEHFAVIAGHPDLFDIDLSDYDEMPVPSNYTFTDNETHTVSGEVLLGTYCPDCGMYQNVRIETVTRTEEHDCTETGRWTIPVCWYPGVDIYYCKYCDHDYEVVYEPAPPHNYLNGICVNCGAEDPTEVTCTHENAVSIEGDEEQWRLVYNNRDCFGVDLSEYEEMPVLWGAYLDSTSHTLSGEILTGTYCPDCGRYQNVRIENVTRTEKHDKTYLIENTATCTATGEATYYCAGCDAEYTVESEMLPHSYVNGVCSVCGAETSVEDCAHANTVSIAGSAEHFAVVAGNPDLFDIDLSGYDGMPELNYTYLDNERHTASGEALLGTYCPDCGLYQDLRIGYITRTEAHKGESATGWHEPTCIFPGYDGCCCELCWEEFRREYEDEPRLTDHEPDRTDIVTCWWKGYKLSCDICEIYDYVVVEEEYDEPHHVNPELTGTVAATCTEAGQNIYFCADCDIEYYEEIAALGHDYLNGICKRCGAEDPAEVTCTHENAVSIEGDEEQFALISEYPDIFGVDLSEYEEMPKLTYTYLNDESHTASGEILKGTYCPDCGRYQNVRMETVSETEAHPRNEEEAFVLEQATCRTAGRVYYDCPLCGEGFLVTVEALTDHEPVRLPVETCWWRGYNLICDVCGVNEIEVEERYDEPRHLASSAELIETTATCTEAGLNYWYCHECDMEYTTEAEAFGHSFVDGVCEHCGINGKITGLVPDFTSVVIGVGQKKTLGYETVPAGAATPGSVTFSSSDTTVATVGKTSGLITAKAAGTAAITITANNGVKTTVKVTVKAAPTAIKMNKTAVTIGERDDVKLSYTMGPSSLDDAVSFTTSNADIATVDADGYVTAVTAGTATVTVKTYNGLTATCKVTVFRAPEGITVTPEEATIEVAKTVTLTAELIGENVGGSYTFHTDSECVTVNETSGIVTAVAPGVATVTAETYNGKTAQAVITVTAAPDTVKLGKTSVAMGLKQTMQLTPVATCVGNECETTFTYASSSTAVATVSSTGLITAKAVGTTTITVKAHNGVKATLKVTVENVPTSIKMSSTSVKVAEDDSVQLKYTLTPSDSAAGVTYSSSDPAIVTVDANGKVTGVSAGTVTITVRTHNGLKTGCNVTVVAGPEGITVTPEESTISAGQTVKLTAALVGDNAMGSYSFSTESDLITVNETSGLVTALKPGEAIVTVESYNGKTAEAVINVVAAPDAVSFGKTSMEMGLGQTAQLKPVATYQGSDNCKTTYTYSSSDTSVVAVSSSGQVAAKATGTATVTVKTHNGVTGTIKITVKAAPTAIALNKTSAQIAVGDVLKLTYTLTPSNTSAGVTYASSNGAVATVDASGNVTAVSEGTATIAIKTHNGLKAACQITVVSMPEGVTVTPETATIAIGQSVTLKATPIGGTVAGNCTFSTDSECITVNESSGLVTAVATGEAVVTVETYNGKTAEAVITVVAAPDAVTLGKTSATMGVAQTLQLKPTATCEGSECPASYTYSSSNTAVATVTTGGKITAKATGTATITVKTHNGVKTTIKITVKAAPTGITLSKTGVSLTAGSSVQLKYTLTASGSATQVTYTSSNPSVATVDANGKVTAVSAGTATIAAKTHNGLKAGCKVTVTGSTNLPK